MIVSMKHLDLLCVAAEKDATLEALRALGAVHLDLSTAQGAEVAGAKEDLAAAEKAVRLIQKARGKNDSGARVPTAVADVLALAGKAEACKGASEELAREIARFEPYGDFDPELARNLLARGVDIRSVAEFPDPLPRKRLRALQADAAALAAELEALRGKLAACDDAAILAQFPGLADRMAFAAAKELMSEQGAVACISGWIPAPQTAALGRAARAQGWGVLLRDPAEGETPPTLIRPPALFRPVKALFEGLGIAPAYREADVSVPFMCYFSLFFAMLVGDGAYGLIFLVGTLLAWRKLPRAWTVLLVVFSLATVGWGVLSNTWFGEPLPFLAALPSAGWLAGEGAAPGHEYDSMMLVCFTIAVTHLMIARIWSGLSMLNSLTCLAQFGWAGIVLFMYLVTNAIVGIFPAIPQWGFYTFYASLALVFVFSVPFRELGSRGIEICMLPLNIMSALGDIISYVRLFAVGLASVKVAQNFNTMALDMDMPLWIKWLPVVLILFVGHALNLAMAGLSILVHAVRLNTLEFSNHKGISWAGYAFSPFKKNTKE